MASVDFCVTLTSTYLPLVAFEVDSDYHDSEKQKVRDERKDLIFTTGGIALMHLRAFGRPSPEAIRHDIMEAVRTWLRQWHTTSHQIRWMVRRKKRGQANKDVYDWVWGRLLGDVVMCCK